MWIPSEPSLLPIPAGFIFVIDLTLSLQPPVPAKSLQSTARDEWGRAKVPDAELRKGQQPDTKKGLHDKAQG